MCAYEHLNYETPHCVHSVSLQECLGSLGLHVQLVMCSTARNLLSPSKHMEQTYMGTKKKEREKLPDPFDLEGSGLFELSALSRTH